MRSRLAKRDALVQAVRESNASLDPAKVAEWLTHQANSWFPATCWAVVARDNSDRLTVMADLGLNPGLGPSLWSAAEWVMSHGTELLSGDLSKDPRSGNRGSGTVMALPLSCRGQVIGVVVGIDPQPSATVPRLAPPFCCRCAASSSRRPSRSTTRSRSRNRRRFPSPTT